MLERQPESLERRGKLWREIVVRQYGSCKRFPLSRLLVCISLQHFNIRTGMKSYRYSDNGAFFWPIGSNLPWPSPARHEWYRLQARGPGLNRPRTNGVPPILHHGSCSVGLRIWTPPSWRFLYIFPKIILYPSSTLRYVYIFKLIVWM